jgi:outer membrane protein
MGLVSHNIPKEMSGVLGFCLFMQTTLGFAMPLSVDQAVKMALDNHLDIKVAENSEEQAKYALQSTEGSRGISIDASNTFYLKQIHYSATTNTTSLALSFPLYSGGKNEGNIEMAKTDVTIAGLTLLKEKQDIKLKTISAYYDVLEDQKVQAVDQETVDNYILHLNNVKAQYSVGNIAKLDVLKSEVELADAQQNLLKAKNSYAVAVNALKNLIRWKSTEPLEFIDDFQHVPVHQTMDQCVTFAKEHRPDVKKYRLSIGESEKNVEVVRADQKPSVSLTAATGWGSSILPKEDNRDMYVGITTSWNLFDGQITKSKIKKAQSAVAAAHLELESQEDSVEVSVKEYYLGLKEAEKRMETTQVAVHEAEEAYFIAEAKYQAGEGVILDVIDAQLALTTAKNNYIAARYDYATYKAKLENAMGLD